MLSALPRESLAASREQRTWSAATKAARSTVRSSVRGPYASVRLRAGSASAISSPRQRDQCADPPEPIRAPSRRRCRDQVAASVVVALVGGGLACD